MQAMLSLAQVCATVSFLLAGGASLSQSHVQMHEELARLWEETLKFISPPAYALEPAEASPPPGEGGTSQL